MFGRKRKRAVAQAVDGVRPMIATYQHFYGLPAGFWQNDYVLGFLGFMISFHLDQASNGRLSLMDKGQSLVDVFTALSNMNGLPITRRFTELANNATDEFQLGGDRASIIAFYVSNSLKDESSHPEIEEAKAFAESAGSPDDREVIAGYLMKALCTDEFRKRFTDQARPRTIVDMP